MRRRMALPTGQLDASDGFATVARPGGPPHQLFAENRRFRSPRWLWSSLAASSPYGRLDAVKTPEDPGPAGSFRRGRFIPPGPGSEGVRETDLWLSPAPMVPCVPEKATLIPTPPKNAHRV